MRIQFSSQSSHIFYKAIFSRIMVLCTPYDDQSNMHIKTNPNRIHISMHFAKFHITKMQCTLRDKSTQSLLCTIYIMIIQHFNTADALFSQTERRTFIASLHQLASMTPSDTSRSCTRVNQWIQTCNCNTST